MNKASFIISALLVLLASTSALAIEIGNESMADKADRFDFEEFHKEKGIVIWDEKAKKETVTYEEKPATDSKAAASTSVPTTTAKPRSNDDKRRFEKGQELKVREAYKLGNDPALRQIPSLFEATEALHQQLNSYCPNGWAKEQEWHKPEQNHYFVHYLAVCL